VQEIGYLWRVKLARLAAHKQVRLAQAEPWGRLVF
jgi:hypothetical protein